MNHLANCSLQPESVWTDAATDRSATTTKLSPSRCRHGASNLNLNAATQSILFQNNESIEGFSVLPFSNHALVAHQPTNIMHAYPPQQMQSPMSMISPLSIPHSASPLSRTPSFALQSPGIISNNSISIASSSQPSVHPSHSSTPLNIYQNLSESSSTANCTSHYGTWDHNRQISFENRLAKVTASAGLPLAWLDNPQVASLFEEFLPLANLPLCKTMTNQIIPNLVADLRQTARNEASGAYATIQADGWTGINHQHLLAFMITARKKVSA